VLGSLSSHGGVLARLYAADKFSRAGATVWQVALICLAESMMNAMKCVLLLMPPHKKLVLDFSGGSRVIKRDDRRFARFLRHNVIDHGS